MNRIERLERKLTTAYGERLPDRIEKHDGKLFGFYGGEKKELDEKHMARLLGEAWAKAGPATLVLNKGEGPEDDMIKVGNYKVSEDLKDITWVIDGKKINGGTVSNI